jgi:hypothetical protein
MSPPELQRVGEIRESGAKRRMNSFSSLTPITPLASLARLALDGVTVQPLGAFTGAPKWATPRPTSFGGVK